eukprot:scaffold3852_cov402-Prasinococcus_capsulatus_cf.AAC.13
MDPSASSNAPSMLRTPLEVCVINRTVQASRPSKMERPTASALWASRDENASSRISNLGCR